MSGNERKRRTAANDTLEEVMRILRASGTHLGTDPDTLDGKVLVQLLQRNFDRLDENGDGSISRDEIANALAKPFEFSQDEYAMLMLLGKYFHTIADLSDDEPGPDTVISRQDAEVLGQFLLYSKLTLADLQHWLAGEQKRIDGNVPEPPPLSGR